MSSKQKQKAPSARTRVRRAPERANYEKQEIERILDAGTLCHVGFVFEERPVLIPTLYWREGGRIFLHGSRASRMMRAIEGAEVCIGVSHLDGLVLARSAFHHSANYRSVCLFGRPEPVPAGDQEHHLRTFMEGLFPGRWERLRPVRRRELNATRLLAMPIDEAAAKIRRGAPDEPEEDREWPVWGGVFPFLAHFGTPEPDPNSVAAALPPPAMAAARFGSTPEGDG